MADSGWLEPERVTDLINSLVLLELLERVLIRPLGLALILLGSLVCNSPSAHLIFCLQFVRFTELSVSVVIPPFPF